MDFTRHRGYPYPSDEYETGNGGLHSELLARAVASDFDQLDAAWADELEHSTKLLKMNGDDSGVTANSDWTIFWDLMDIQTQGNVGIGTANTSDIRIAPGGDGFYHVAVSTRAGASGTITANAIHRLTSAHYRVVNGVSTLIRERYNQSFQTGSGEMFLGLQYLTRLQAGDRIRTRYFHTNTGSNVTIFSAGSNFGATKIVGT